MFRFIPCIVIFIVLILYTCTGFAEKAEPFIINAVITLDKIEFFPNTIPENTPFIIHVINHTNTPIELENTDTSVEIYANMDKTFKVGLAAGDYTFFDDFNPHATKVILFVKPDTIVKNIATRIQPAINNNSSSHVNISEILFVIWRESVEALLVVGVVYNWLKQLKSGRRSGFVFLWIGVIIGLLCSLLLSFLLINVSHLLSPHFSAIFQAGITLIAAIMIVYMVKWMRENGRTLKSNMHHSLEKKSSLCWRNISILTVVSVAFAREASEASIFIYALSIGNTDITLIKMIILLLLGIFLALSTIYLLQLGNKIAKKAHK